MQTQHSGIPPCIGIGLLIIGITSVLAICALTFVLLLSVNTVFQEQEVILIGGLVALVAFVALVVPGTILIVVGKRRG